MWNFEESLFKDMKLYMCFLCFSGGIMGLDNLDFASSVLDKHRARQRGPISRPAGRLTTGLSATQLRQMLEKMIHRGKK